MVSTMPFPLNRQGLPVILFGALFGLLQELIVQGKHFELPGLIRGPHGITVNLGFTQQMLVSMISAAVVAAVLPPETALQQVILGWVGASGSSPFLSRMAVNLERQKAEVLARGVETAVKQSKHECESSDPFSGNPG
jgi:uncharacterized membrane protein YeaQ/YmgE (transglycosylase-associated protein family)